MENEQILIDVNFDVQAASQNLSVVIQQLGELKAEQRELTKEIKSGNDADGEKAKRLAEVSREVDRLKSEQKTLTAGVQAQIAANNTYGDSLNEMRRKLGDMHKAYDAMSAEMRDSSAGKAFLEQLRAQKDAVQELESATGRHQRNVGNYPDILKEVKGHLGSVTSAVAALKAGSVSAFGAIAVAAKGLGKALLTPPLGIIIAILGAVLQAVNAVTKAVKRNDDAMTALSTAAARFTPIMTGVRKVFDMIGKAIANAVEWMTRFMEKIGLFDFGDAAAASAEIVKAQDALEERERKYAVESAKRNREIAELRSKATETTKYGYKERMQMLQQAIDLEKANLADERLIAQERLRIAKAQAAEDVDTTDERKNQIAQLEAAVEQAEQNYYEGTRRLNSQLNAARKEELQAVKAQAAAAQKVADDAATEQARAAAEQAKARLQAVQKEIDEYNALMAQREQIRKTYEDAVIASIEDDEEREAAAERMRGLRQIEELQAQQAALGENEIAARQQIADTIALIEQQTEDRITQIHADAAKARADEDAEQIRGAQAAVAKMREDNSKAVIAMLEEGGELIGGLLAEYAEQNHAAAVAGKALALGQIAVNTGVAIAKGTAAASDVPFPANLAAIATTVAQVLAQMNAARQALKNAKFEGGGIVGGNSYKGDNVIVRVNSGEMILNRDTQQGLFAALKSGNFGDNNATALAAALREMPAPVMVYREFADFQQQTTTIKELSTL